MSKIAPLQLDFAAGTTQAGNQRVGSIYAMTGKWGTYIAIDGNKTSEKSKPKAYSIEAFIGIADALGLTKNGAGQKFLDRLTKLMNEGCTFDEGGVVVKPAKAAKAAPKVDATAAKTSTDEALEELKGLDPAMLAAIVSAVKATQG